MKRILERFKNGKLAVNCQTKEEAKQFIKLCYENGIEWCDSAATETYFDDYGERTCYVYNGANLRYCNNEYAVISGRTRISYSDFMNEYNNSLSKSNLNVEIDMKPIQRQNYMNMLEALGLKPEELSDRVNGSIAYLAMDEASTIDNLCTAIRQARGVK